MIATSATSQKWEKEFKKKILKKNQLSQTMEIKESH